MRDYDYINYTIYFINVQLFWDKRLFSVIQFLNKDAMTQVRGLR